MSIYQRETSHTCTEMKVRQLHITCQYYPPPPPPPQYVELDITVGFTMSRMVITGHSAEICVNVTHPLVGMDPVTLVITSGTYAACCLIHSITLPSMPCTDKDATQFLSTVAVSEHSLVSCVSRNDTSHDGVVIYKLSSINTNQPLQIFPDTLTVTLVQ